MLGKESDLNEKSLKSNMNVITMIGTWMLLATLVVGFVVIALVAISKKKQKTTLLKAPMKKRRRKNL